jgi:3-hydroxyisobutyrate dehydrogenase
MAAGAPEAFEKAGALLEAMGAKIYRLGDTPGQGTTVKVAHQLLAGVHIAAAAEAMAFGTKIGCDPQTLYDVVCNAAGNSWMFENRVPFMLDDDMTPVSAVEIFVKDLGLVLEAGKSERFGLPIASAAHQLFLEASGLGHGGDNDAAVVKVYEKLSGVSVKRR